jgi:hypothetical protein
VVVRNSAGAVSSIDVTVLVTGAPWIIAPPADQTVLCYGTATFGVTGDSSTPADPLTYQWRLAGTNLPGKTDATLVVENVTGENAGPYSVVVGNSHGSVISSNAWVIFDDTVPPSIFCPDNMNLECGTPAVFTVPAFSSCGGAVPVTCTPPSGTVLPVGQNTITCEARTPTGPVANCSFVIAVADTLPPVISGCSTNITTTNTVVTWAAPTAVDACLGNVPVVCTPPSGSTFPSGTTTVLCSAVDGANNTASCSFTVTVGNAIEQVRLSIVPQGGGVLVSWPTVPEGVGLYYATSLGTWHGNFIIDFPPYGGHSDGDNGIPPNWQPYLGALTTNGNTISAAITLTNNTMFFQLKKP